MIAKAKDTVHFQDETGDTWKMRPNIPTARALREIGFLTTDIVNEEKFGEVYQNLQRDPIYLADLLAAACAAEIGKRALSAEQFDERLTIPTLDAARPALLMLLAEFAPPNIRPALQKMLVQIELIEQVMAEKVLGAIDKATDLLMESQLDASQLFSRPTTK